MQRTEKVARAFLGVMNAAERESSIEAVPYEELEDGDLRFAIDM